MKLRDDSFFVTELNARREWETLDGQLNAMYRGYARRAEKRGKDAVRHLLAEAEENMKRARVSFRIWETVISNYLYLPKWIRQEDLDERIIAKVTRENGPENLEEHMTNLRILADQTKNVREAAIRVNDLYIEFMLDVEL